MVSTETEARRSHLADGRWALALAERGPSRWLWRRRRRRKLMRWNLGLRARRTSFAMITAVQDELVMTVGPAGEHTSEQVARQEELLAHNQRGRLCVLYAHWD